MTHDPIDCLLRKISEQDDLIQQEIEKRLKELRRDVEEASRRLTEQARNYHRNGR